MSHITYIYIWYINIHSEYMILVYMLKYQLQTRLSCFIFKQRKCKELSFFLNFDTSLHHLFDLVPSPQTKMLAPENVDPVALGGPPCGSMKSK